MKLISERMQKRGQQGGFTLIELLVVIAILAILGGVAVFAVGNLTTESEAAACTIEARTVKTAAAAYRADGLGVPTAVTDLQPTWLDPGATLGTYTFAAGVPTQASCP